MKQKKIILSCLLVIVLIGIITALHKIDNKVSVDENVISTSQNEKNTKVIDNDYIKPLQEVAYPTSFEFEDEKWEAFVRRNPVRERFFDMLKDFSFKTAVEVLNQRDGNINYSPVSLYYALAFIASGAERETLEELQDLLGLRNKEDYQIQCGNFYRASYYDNNIGKFKMANSLWMDENIVCKSDFIKSGAEDYYASSYGVNFSKVETTKAIQKWIYDNSNGTLDSNTELDTQQILSMLSVVSFNDEWEKSFDKEMTESGIFTLSDGTEVNCDYLSRNDEDMYCYKGDGYTRASLSFKNSSGISFILPDEGVSISELISDVERLKSTLWYGTWTLGKLVWKIPKFEINSKLDLKTSLQNLGAVSMFEENANFKSITEQNVHISTINQETHIDINENGINASKFTQMEQREELIFDGKSEMILNRPFIYCISTSGVILYIGICENPCEK